MPRPLRLSCSGALFHVTARGAQQAPIFLDDHDRSTMLGLVARVLQRNNARAYAYCLMGNHYHFVIQTGLANLSEVMHRINAVYSQSFNKRHDRHGHLLEGRFKAVHVQRDNYLLQACRYVDLNPVRAHMVNAPGDWKWSSYRAHVGSAPSPAWLATSELHEALTHEPQETQADTDAARELYAAYCFTGKDSRLWQESLRHGLYLGDDAFVERVRGGDPVQ